MNQTCSISLPCVFRVPLGHEPSGSGASPRLSFRTQTTCECQRAIGPAGVGPATPRRTLNIAPTRVGARPGSRGVDQRLGTLRVENVAVGAEAAMLGVEPPHGDVAGGPPREVGVEAAPLRGADVPPPLGGDAQAREESLGRLPLGGAGEREVGVLREVRREPVPDAGSERHSSRRQRAQRLRRVGRRCRGDGDEGADERGQCDGDRMRAAHRGSASSGRRLGCGTA